MLRKIILYLMTINKHQENHLYNIKTKTRKQVKKILILILFLLIVFTIHAQEFATRLYTPQQDGLINTQVNCVKQAPDGRIWVGTQGGISCFDGLEFKNYTEEDGLSANLIYDLYPLRDTIFVLTRDGIDLIINESTLKSINILSAVGYRI